MDPHAVLRYHRRMETRASGYKGFCSECGDKWWGDPEAGGCAAARLAKRVIELEAERDTLRSLSYSMERHLREHGCDRGFLAWAPVRMRAPEGGAG